MCRIEDLTTEKICDACCIAFGSEIFALDMLFESVYTEVMKCA